MAIRAWDRRFRDLVQLTTRPRSACSLFKRLRRSRPRPTQRIALLGDAIHAMTPHRDIGANVALKDAVRLCRALQAVNCGEQTLLDALRTCETEMIDYGFRAARTSLYARQ